MSRFRPARASPPPFKPAVKRQATPTDFLDDPRADVLAAVPELAALSQDEVEFIDAVIERASATATTFLTVFKAYNDILQERGLDPEHEVVYYGKLLKLGTLKGKNWGEKWEMVKAQQMGIPGPSKPRRQPPPPARGPQPPAPRAQVLTRLTGTLKALERESDAYTVPSRDTDTDAALSEATAETEDGHTFFARGITPVTATTTTRRPVSPALTATTNSLGLTTTDDYPTRLDTPAYKLRRPYSTPAPVAWDDAASEISLNTTKTPSVPPSYGAATRQKEPVTRSSYAPLRVLAHVHSKTASLAPPAPSHSHHPVAPSARTAVLQARERKGSVINEDEAWKKIQMARDEEEADRFREERLVERCYDVWKQGYEWIVTTNEQIAQARENLIVRVAFHKWRSRTASRRDLYQRVAAVSDSRRLKAAMQVWHAKLKERKQLRWRHDMRTRMKIVRDNHDRQLQKEAWTKWKLAFRGYLAEQHYYRQLLLRFHDKWRQKLIQLDRMDATADQFAVGKEKGLVKKYWGLWDRAVMARRAERVMSGRVDMRILASTYEVWKRRLHENRVADTIHDRLILRRAFGAWKAAKGRIQTLDHRVEKHVGRQNEVLIRAVWRIWKTREGGRLLERVRGMRIMKKAFAMWTKRMQDVRQQEDLAVAFANRPRSALAAVTLQKWKEVRASHQNAHAFAVHYHSSQLQYKMLLTWRLQLRAKLKQLKQARQIEKQFLVRRAWRQWQERTAEKNRERKLKEFEAGILRKFMHGWLKRAQTERQKRTSEEIIRQRVALRIMTTALNRWTNRVADIKFRELDVITRYENTLVSNAFKKWKALCIRHVEELSLMESYQDVKREESIRRMFYRWLTAARKVRHRRRLLQEREQEMQLAKTAEFYDKWRERYLDIRLQPLADQFLLQSSMNQMYRAFGIWHSKTKSLPAVRFHASHLKAKIWKIWREAVPPPQLTIQAREKYNNALLAKMLAQWVEKYRATIKRKAAARAVYLTSVTSSRSEMPTKSRRPLRAVSPLPSETEASEVPARRPPPVSRPPRGRPNLTSLLAERSRSPPRPEKRTLLSASPSRPRMSTRASTVRDPSPARSSSTYATRRSETKYMSAPPSVVDGEIPNRSRLWKELQNVQQRSRPPTEGGRSRF